MTIRHGLTRDTQHEEVLQEGFATRTDDAKTPGNQTKFHTGRTRGSRRKARKFLRESHGRNRVVEEREEQARRHGANNTEARRVEARHQKVHENWKEQGTVWEKRRNANEFDTAPTPKSDTFTCDEPCSTPLDEHTEVHPYRKTEFPMKNAKTKRVEVPVSQEANS